MTQVMACAGGEGHVCAQHPAPDEIGVDARPGIVGWTGQRQPIHTVGLQRGGDVGIRPKTPVGKGDEIRDVKGAVRRHHECVGKGRCLGESDSIDTIDGRCCFLTEAIEGGGRILVGIFGRNPVGRADARRISGLVNGAREVAIGRASPGVPLRLYEPMRQQPPAV